MGNIDSTTVGTGGGYYFRLNQLPNYAEFTALFDAYRINKVVMRFIPQYNQINTNTNVGAPVTVPLMYTVIDYDDVTSPTGGVDLQQYASCKTMAGNKPFTMVIVPKTATPVYRNNVASAYLQNNPRQWIDCTYPDVEHYGVRFFMNPSLVLAQFSYTVEATFYIAFKNVR